MRARRGRTRRKRDAGSGSGTDEWEGLSGTLASRATTVEIGLRAPPRSRFDSVFWGAAPVTSANDRGPRAPKHLSERSRALWARIARDYALETPHFELLRVALEARDRMEEAREIIAEEGAVIRDRFGTPKRHPALTTEETARVQFLRAMRELDLEGEPLPDPRPARRL
jgi:P27 family predicted phage terminase small subunit